MISLDLSPMMESWENLFRWGQYIILGKVYAKRPQLTKLRDFPPLRVVRRFRLPNLAQLC